jgi:uncharacterized membrane protein YjfL (UPF0719 family)
VRMKGWEVPEIVFWIIIAIVVGLIVFLFTNQLLMGYLNVRVSIP